MKPEVNPKKTRNIMTDLLLYILPMFEALQILKIESCQSGNNDFVSPVANIINKNEDQSHVGSLH